MMTDDPANSALPLVDTHAHLDFPDYSADRDAVMGRAQAAGLTAIISIGIEPGDWEATLMIAEGYATVYPALGVHPNSADEATEEALAQLFAMCRDPERKRVVALGETGLDYYRQHASHERQREAFRAHLDLARQLDLPVIIHNRDAHADILSILERDGKGTRGVMHSFSGDLQFAVRCIEMGYLISLSGPVTFKKAYDKHEIAAKAPLDRLLVETDCPFLTPEPFRGRRNEPAYVGYTARAVAKLRGVPLAEVANATTQNAYTLFNIEPTQPGRSAHPTETDTPNSKQGADDTVTTLSRGATP